MKTGELIQRVQSLYSKGVESDDSRLTNRHIYNKLLTARDSVIFKNKQYSNMHNKDSIYQIVDCENLEQANLSDCSCYALNDCYVSKTSCELPEIKYFNGELLIANVSSIDGAIRFNKTTFEQFKYIGGNRFTANKPWYFIKNNYLYVSNTYKMKQIRIKAAFTNPVKAYLYDCKNGTNCKDLYEAEFPVPEEFIDEIISYAINELVTTLYRTREDLSNDSKDSIIQNSK